MELAELQRLVGKTIEAVCADDYSVELTVSGEVISIRSVDWTYRDGGSGSCVEVDSWPSAQ